jgi:hypothetical protein
MTKIGYNPDLANTRGINWSSLAKTIVDDLNTQQQERETRIANAEKAIDDERKKLASTPMGQDAAANQWIMNGVEAITETAGRDERLWKNGLLKTKDYLRNQANRERGTDFVLQTFQNYNKDYDKIIEGIKNKEYSEKTLDLRAQLQKLFNFDETGIVINPEDSEVNVGKLVQNKNGEMVLSDNPNDFLNASEMIVTATGIFERFDADEAAKKLADSLALKTVIDGFGNTVTQAYNALENLDDKTKKKIQNARTAQIKAILSPDALGSFLRDDVGLAPNDKEYYFTRDANDTNEEAILIDQQNMNVFKGKKGQDQLNYAVEKFNERLETFLPYTKTAPKKPRESVSERGNRVNAENRIKTAAKFFYGDKAQQDEAFSYFANILRGMRGGRVTQDKVIFDFVDFDGKATGEKNRFYSRSFDRTSMETLMDGMASLLGSASAGITQERALQLALGAVPKDLKGIRAEGVGLFEIKPNPTLTEEFNIYVETEVGKLIDNIELDKTDNDLDDTKLVNALNKSKILKDFGIEVETSGIASDEIKLFINKDDTRNEVTTTIDLEAFEGVEDAKRKITEAINLFVNNNANLIEGGLKAGREKIMKVSNKAREDARPTFAEWSKQNPGKTMKDYRIEYGI